eukprot:4500041-Pyramimonas_sp.AAC.1
MDFPLYPDYHAQVTGNPRVGMQPESPYARATADDCHQSQLTRGSGYTSGVLGQILIMDIWLPLWTLMRRSRPPAW